MKKYLIVFALIAACLIGCKSTGGSIKDFSDAMGKDLKLLTVHVDSAPFSRIVLYDRDDLKKEKIENTYTLNFSANTISGVGAPSRYSAPYTRNADQTIKIEQIRATTLAPIVQPEKLQESVFFAYMQNAYEWKVEGGKLVLLTKGEDESPVRLVFGL